MIVILSLFYINPAVFCRSIDLAGARVNCVHGDGVRLCSRGAQNGADGGPRAALAGGDLAGAI